MNGVLRMTNKALEKAVDHEKQKQTLEDLEKFDQSGYTEQRDIAVGLFNSVQIHNGYEKLANVAKLVQLSKIKENKAYRHLSGFSYEINGETGEMSPTWEGFLHAIGLNRRTVDEHLLNMHTVGEEAFNAMTKAGLGSRAFKKLRQLSNEDRSILVNEVEANLDDKDSIINLIDGISEKHEKEMQALTHTNEDLNADLNVSRKLVSEQSDKVNELKEKLYHQEHYSKYPSLVNDTRVQCTEAAGKILFQLDVFDQLRDRILNADLGEYANDEGALNPMFQSYLSMLWQVQVRVADLLEYAYTTFGDGVQHDFMDRAYPDIKDDMRAELEEQAFKEGDAIAEYAKSSKVH